MSTATIRLQKYSSLPWPNGCSGVAGRWLNLMPTSSNTPLKVSTAEWMPSDSIAELPVMPATTNLVAAMATLAPIAP
jgi:hypothetical protein